MLRQGVTELLTELKGDSPSAGAATVARGLVEALREPAAYPWRPRSVTLIETHLSWVFLAGDYVVKVKRPVIYPFVDYSTLARRHQSCLDEVRLNRRLTDGVYLAAVPISREAAGYRVGGDGPAVEWATLMRRLPAAGMLDQLLATGRAPSNLAELLATRLIPFHRDLIADCHFTSFGDPDALDRVLTDNLDELDRFAGGYLPPGQLALAGDAVRAFLTTHERFLTRRATDGWIRDGHGDLRAEHICLEPNGRLQIYDCVEFNPALRCADVASDLAFLLMDLERLGAGAVAAALTAQYRRAGIALPPELLNLYRAHRALVRAKVACLTHEAGTKQPALLEEAVRYLDLATRATLIVHPMLIVMTGLSATGKSSVAHRLGRMLGAPVIQSDAIRRQLAGITGRTPASQTDRVYGTAMTDATYGRLLTQATAVLEAGRPVIADATFLANDHREQAASVAARLNVPIVFIETVCSPVVVETRLAQRLLAQTVESDADLAVYRLQQAAITQAPPTFPAAAKVIHVDTSDVVPDLLDPPLKALCKAGHVEPGIVERDPSL